MNAVMFPFLTHVSVTNVSVTLRTGYVDKSQTSLSHQQDNLLVDKKLFASIDDMGLLTWITVHWIIICIIE